MKVFLDTDVLASALATRGLCAELFEAVLAEHDLLTSQAVLTELERILASKFRLPDVLVHGHTELILGAAQCLVETVDIAVAIPDPDDVPILAAALAGQAGCFVTGDKALLELGELDGMPILSPRQFWERYRLGPRTGPDATGFDKT